DQERPYGGGAADPAVSRVRSAWRDLLAALEPSLSKLAHGCAANHPPAAPADTRPLAAALRRPTDRACERLSRARGDAAAPKLPFGRARGGRARRRHPESRPLELLPVTRESRVRLLPSGDPCACGHSFAAGAMDRVARRGPRPPRGHPLRKVA